MSLDEHIEDARRVAGSGGTSTRPIASLQQKETGGAVWRALDALPFDQRTVVVLREIDGLSYDEIADSLGVAVGTVKSRLARARENLRAALRRE